MRPGTLLRYRSCKEQLGKIIKNKDVVLDIGGYDGFILSKLKEKKDFTAIILDLDKRGLKIAKKRGLKTILGSGTKIPLKRNSVDVLLLLDVIEHLKQDKLLIKEAKRVLKKYGILILTTPIKNKKLVPFISMRDMKKLHKSWGHVKNGYTDKELRSLLNDFVILKLTTYFNLLSRYAYFFLFYLNFPISHKIKILIYNIVTKTEKYIKLGGIEHLIICRNNL